MSLARPLLSIYASYVKQRFMHKTRHLMENQERFLKDLLVAHQQTKLGQEWGLKDIKTIDQFRDQVPVLPYSFYESYTDRIAQGESNVLNPHPVGYISLTSGSTGNKKRVPVTRQFQHTLRQADLASLGFLLDGLQRRQRSFGKFFITNSVQVQGKTSAGIEYGPVSVGSIRKAKMLFEQTFSHPFQTLEISDTLARHYVCLLFALRDSNLRGMAANFPMLILRTCGYLERYAEELIHDLETGAIAPWLQIDPEIRANLEKRLSADPTRAAQLRSVLRREGRLTPQHAWSRLSFITTARGGTSNFYLERFPEYFGDTPVFGGVYGSAEATFGVCPDVDVDGNILAIESGFFEFLPADQWDCEHPKTLLPHEVQVGDRYRILVTSYSGFYRYDIGDVVEVVGFYEQTPLIVFRYRHGGLLSSTTEKTTEFHVTQVMQRLQQEFNVHLDDFCITLSDAEFPARYLVNIELAPGQTLSHPDVFLQRFEHWMQQVNNPYSTVRQGQVPPPQLRILAPGSFASVRQRQVERGMFDSQLKVPHISEDRGFLAGLPILQTVDLAPSAEAVKDGLTHPQVCDRTASHTASPEVTEAITKRSLPGANLIQSNLSHANLKHANLANADLSGANLSGTDLSDANLAGAYLREADLSYTNLTGANLRDADLTDANLTGACLKNAHLQGAYLTRAQLTHADFSHAQLQGTFLWQVTLQHTNLAGVDLQDAILKRIDLTPQQVSDLSCANNIVSEEVSVL